MLLVPTFGVTVHDSGQALGGTTEKKAGREENDEAQELRTRLPAAAPVAVLNSNCRAESMS